MDLKPLRNGYEGKFSYMHFATIKVCKTKGMIIACGNFISYQEILKEELSIKDEYNGKHP